MAKQSNKKRTAILLDFDHTIFDTSAFVENMQIFWRSELSSDAMDRIKTHLKDFRNGKFEIYRPQDHMTAADWELHKQRFTDWAPKLLHSDAMDFIQKYQTAHDIFILTFGDKEFQEAKVVASRLSFPVIYTDDKNKMKTIRDWRSGDAYRIGEQSFTEIILIDDRHYSFEGFDQLLNSRGFLVERTKILSDVMSNLPSNVSVVSSLSETTL